MRRSLALSLLAVAALATNTFAAEAARLTGKVLDGATKQPIANATITVQATEAKTFKQDYKTGKDGTYAIYLLDGTIHYKFTYTAAGYAPWEETAKLKIGEPNSRDIFLTPANAAAPANGTAPTAQIKADPSVASYNEGAALANEGKDAEALAKFQEAVTAKPELIAGWEALARVQLRMKKYPEAIVSANKALALAPDETDMNAVLFDAYTATGDKAKAAEMRAKLPANAGGLYNDAVKLLNANKDGEAEPILKQAIAADPTFALAYFQLGMVYVRSGKSADAKTNLQKYLELDPKGAEAATATEMLKYVK